MHPQGASGSFARSRGGWLRAHRCVPRPKPSHLRRTRFQASHIEHPLRYQQHVAARVDVSGQLGSLALPDAWRRYLIINLAAVGFGDEQPIWSAFVTPPFIHDDQAIALIPLTARFTHRDVMRKATVPGLGLSDSIDDEFIFDNAIRYSMFDECQTPAVGIPTEGSLVDVVTIPVNGVKPFGLFLQIFDQECSYSYKASCPPLGNDNSQKGQAPRAALASSHGFNSCSRHAGEQSQKRQR